MNKAQELLAEIGEGARQKRDHGFGDISNKKVKNLFRKNQNYKKGVALLMKSVEDVEKEFSDDDDIPRGDLEKFIPNIVGGDVMAGFDKQDFKK